MNNKQLLFKGLVCVYNTLDKSNKYYLTQEQIKGIIDYLENNELTNIDIINFIDDIIINYYGFNSKGLPQKEGK